MSSFQSVAWVDGKLHLIDQHVLPFETKYNDYSTAKDVADAIRSMVTRGAPNIGISAAYGLALTALNTNATDVESLTAEIESDAEILRQSRPTAVNLFWAIDRVMKRIADSKADNIPALQEVIF